MESACGQWAAQGRVTDWQEKLKLLTFTVITRRENINKLLCMGDPAGFLAALEVSFVSMHYQPSKASR